MPIMSESVFPNAAAAWKPIYVEMLLKLTLKNAHHCRNAKLSSKCKVNVLSSNDHDKVVEEAKANEGEGVVISQLF